MRPPGIPMPPATPGSRPWPSSTASATPAPGRSGPSCGSSMTPATPNWPARAPPDLPSFMDRSRCRGDTREDRVEFGLLGPLVVEADGAQVTVSAGKQRVLLAALLLRANHVVSPAELADAVWEGSPPETARVTLQNYVKRLRQALGPAGYERIVTRPAGYLIEVGPAELDVARFSELQQAGRAAARAAAWEAASAQLGAALALWRGEPLADVPSRLLAQA